MTDEITDAIADFKRTQLPKEEELTKLEELAQEQLDCLTAIGVYENLLKEENEKLTKVQTVKIPELMRELGLESITLISGESVTVKDMYFASIPPDRYQEAMDWLGEHEYGDMIKVGLELKFNKGEKDSAIELSQELQERGLLVSEKEGVHWKTLQAWSKRMILGKEKFPQDLFGVFILPKAEIK